MKAGEGRVAAFAACRRFARKLAAPDATLANGATRPSSVRLPTRDRFRRFKNG